MDVSVLIAGAGPVGLTLACQLDRHGVEHRIVDAAPDRATVSRATDLHARSLELWDHTGVAQAIMTSALTLTGVPLLSDGREVARLDFAGIDSCFPAAVSLRQRDLEELLCEHLATPVERGLPAELVHQDDDAVVVRVGGDELRAGFLVACNGGHSALREALGIGFEGGDYPGRWAVMDAEIDGWPYGEGEIPVFLDHDGFWAMPLPDGRLRLFLRDDGAGEQPEPADGQAVIDRHVPGKPRIRAADNRACFSLHHRVAERFRLGRVFLAGDAAHRNDAGRRAGHEHRHPGRVQPRLEAPAGPRKKLARAARLIRGRAPSRRRGHHAGLRPAARRECPDRRAGRRPRPSPRGLAGHPGPGAGRRRVRSHELGVAYPDSPIVDSEWTAGALGVQPGGRIPDAGPLVCADGSPTSLRELLRDTGLQIWICAGAGC